MAALAAVALSAGLLGGGIGAAVVGPGSAGSVATGSSVTPTTSVMGVSTAAAGTGESVAAKVAPSVVSIEVRMTASRSPFGSAAQRGSSGSGSGVVISSDGLILTNNHVVSQGALSVTFSDGRTVPAELVQADPVTDLAVIKAQGVNDAQPIVYGSSAELAVGETVYAMGSPLGLSGTFTSGIVSALHRPVVPQADARSGSSSVIDAIQTDAPINPGSSGGALVDGAGNLVGITSAIASLSSGMGGQSGSIGLGFAIPVDQARVIADQLAKGLTVAHGHLGVQVGDSTNETVRGALLGQISADGPAAKAGLRQGDIVTRFDGRMIDTADALLAGVRSQQPNTTHEITYIRDGKTKTGTVTVGSDAAGAQS